MKRLVSSLFLYLLFSATAMATPPSFNELAKLPVIRFGDPVPSTDYILLFPAGKPVTITVSIEGTLFSRTAKTELYVTPEKEILVFKDWASLDGVKWVPRSDLIKSDVTVKVPGYNHPYPGVIKVRMDLAETK